MFQQPQSRDIDVQPHTDKLALCWFGFEHPHLDITYKLAFGTSPGGSDVTQGYITVENNLQYEKTGLNLVAFQVNFILLSLV